jgi:predicted nucleic acid-binding protein
VSAYADTSFLASLFLIEDRSQQAREALQQEGSAITLTPLSLLELRNSFNLAVVREKISPGEVYQLWQLLENMLGAGIFIEATPPTAALYEKALELSDRHTPTVATRSLDLLHVAAAALLGVSAFYTFDERQRQAAVAEGLAVFP